MLSVAVLAMAMRSTHAAEIVWAGSSSGNWNLPANWNPAQVPSTNDTAIVTNAGTYTVTLNMNPVVDHLVLGGASGTQTLAITGRTLTIDGGAMVGTNGWVNFNGGKLAGNGIYTLQGTMKWISGELASNAVLHVAADGRCDIASGPQYHKYLYGHLANEGVLTWQPTGSLVLGGTLHNLATGLFDAQIDGGSIIDAAGTGTIINDGTFLKTGGSGNINCYVAVTNNGTMDIQTGSLTLHGGAVFNDGCAFTGAGKTQLTGGTNIIDGHIHSENLNLLYSATLTGSGTIGGAMVWGGGYIGEDAVLTLATNGLLVASGVHHKNLYGYLANNGVLIWQPSGSLVLEGTLYNAPSGLIDIQTDNISIHEQESGARLVNAGTIRKASGAVGNNCYVAVTNTGILQILAGKLNFQGGFENAGGTILLEGGDFQSNEALDLQDGLLAGWGTVHASVTHAGIVRPSRTNGVLAISGDYVQRLAGATVFEIGGSQPGVDQSRLNVAGAAHLGGSVNVEWADGYLPEPGTNFPVMAYAAREGSFDFRNGFILPGHGRRLEPSYGPSLLELAAVAAPEPAGVPLGIATEDGSAMVAWPLEFTGWELHAKTNLLQAGWTAVPTTGNHHLETPPLPPSRFFRLVQP